MKRLCPKRIAHILCLTIYHQSHVVDHAILVSVQGRVRRNGDILYHFQGILVVVGIAGLFLFQHIGLDHAVLHLRKIGGDVNLAVGNGVHVFCQGTIGVGAVVHGDHVLGLVCHKVVRISGGELCKQNDIVHLLHTVGSLCGNAAERDSGKTQYCTQHHWKRFRESMFFHLFSPVRTGFGLSWYNTSIIPYGGAFPQ